MKGGRIDSVPPARRAPSNSHRHRDRDPPRLRALRDCWRGGLLVARCALLSSESFKAQQTTWACVGPVPPHPSLGPTLLIRCFLSPEPLEPACGVGKHNL